MQDLLTVGVIGLAVVAVVAIHLSLTNPNRSRGRGRRDDRPVEPVRAPDMDDIDAEFFRIIDRELLRDI